MNDLRSVPLFSGLSEEALEALQERLKLRRYRKNELIMREGSLGDSMYIIRSGQVQVLSESKSGQPDVVITHLGPGAPVGEMGPILSERRSATVRVIIDTELWELKKDDLEELFNDYPSIAFSFCRELARRLTRTTRQRVQREKVHLVAVMGSDIPRLALYLARITGEQIMLLDLGGLRGETKTISPQVTVEQMDMLSEPDNLSNRLGQLVGQYDRVLMAIPRHENALTRKAAEQAEVIIELGGRSTPWVKRFARNGNYWYHPVVNGSVPQIARRIAQRRVGLALSSGNARSIAHIGVLQVLEREGIPVDMIAGTSGGGLFGALYAAGKSVDEIIEFAKELPKITSLRGGLWDFNLPPRTGIIRGDKTQKFLDKIFEGKTFDETRIPMNVVAADVITGEEVIFNSGPLSEAVRATVSIVGIMDPVNINGRWLVDGAAVNPVPASILRDEVDIIVASSVIVSLEERMHRRAMKQSGRLPNMLALTFGKEEIMEAGIIQTKMGRVDALIQPDVTLFEGLDFHRAEEFIEAGAEAAEQLIPMLKAELEPQPARVLR